MCPLNSTLAVDVIYQVSTALAIGSGDLPLKLLLFVPVESPYEFYLLHSYCLGGEDEILMTLYEGQQTALAFNRKKFHVLMYSTM